MSIVQTLTKKLNPTVIFLGFFLLIAFLNDGFMGTDEYWNAMVKYLPAQTSTYTDLVDQTDVKTPLQVMPMHFGSQIALKLGVFHPYDQYRFTILFMTIFNLLIYILSFQIIYSTRLWDFGGGFKLPDGVSSQKWLDLSHKVFILLFTFYFASSFTLTRPMFESLAAPWILLSMALFYRYKNDNNVWDLVASTVTVSMAFVMRQQAGIGAVTIPLLLLLAKDFRGVAVSSVVGSACFILAGIPDIFLRGGFHHSLISVLTYNVEHGREYGNGSILFYPALLMGLSFFPFLWIGNTSKQVAGPVLKKLNYAWVLGPYSDMSQSKVLSQYSGNNLRKEILIASGISTQDLDSLALLSREMDADQIKDAARDFIRNGMWPSKPMDKSNTRDPIYGAWVERLVRYREYKKAANNAGFKIEYFIGEYDENYSNGIKKFLAKSLNIVLKRSPIFKKQLSAYLSFSENT